MKVLPIRNILLMILFVLVFWVNTPLKAQPISEQKGGDPAEAVVTEIYNLVSFSAGTTPDWEKVKSLFIEDAVVVMRSSRDSLSVFSVEEFVGDFVNFINQSHVDETGFVEKIITVKSVVFGDIAHCFVVYEASIPNRLQPPQRGVDSFQLAKIGDRWRIVSIINEIPRQGMPIPEKLME